MHVIDVLVHDVGGGGALDRTMAEHLPPSGAGSVSPEELRHAGLSDAEVRLRFAFLPLLSRFFFCLTSFIRKKELYSLCTVSSVLTHPIGSQPPLALFLSPTTTSSTHTHSVCAARLRGFLVSRTPRGRSLETAVISPLPRPSLRRSRDVVSRQLLVMERSRARPAAVHFTRSNRGQEHGRGRFHANLGQSRVVAAAARVGVEARADGDGEAKRKRDKDRWVERRRWSHRSRSRGGGGGGG